MYKYGLLGKCPGCGGEDSLTFGEVNNKVSCESCGQGWDDGFELRRANKGLIYVALESYPQRIVRLTSPQKNEVACSRLIVTVLNAALMVHFNLTPNFAVEGGVSGGVGEEIISLENIDEEIGLIDEYGFPENLGCQEILGRYGEFLEALFLKELIFKGESFGTASILKLSTEDPVSYSEYSYRLLWTALASVTGEESFPAKVFERISREIPSVRPFISGLTDGEIMARFVPPPLG